MAAFPSEVKQAAIAAGAKKYIGRPCKRGHDGLRYVSTNTCVHCSTDRAKTDEAKAAKKRHYETNKSLYIERAAKSYLSNREKKIAYACGRQKKMLAVIAARRAERMEKDDVFACKERIRGLIRECLKKHGHQKNSKTVEILGCSIEEFKKHIERQFLEGMNWSNRDKWEIDHIVPMATAKTEEDAIRLNHHTNLRPLWTHENRAKSGRLIFLI